MISLHEVQRALRSRLPNDVQYGMLNTRLILRTGVNLSSFSPAQNRDAALVARVEAALKEFGYPVH